LKNLEVSSEKWSNLQQPTL